MLSEKEIKNQKSLKALRILYGIKQYELADELFITRSLVSHWETLSARCTMINEAFDAIKRIVERKERLNVSTKDA